jgi:hypothetical protein
VEALRPWFAFGLSPLGSFAGFGVDVPLRFPPLYCSLLSATPRLVPPLIVVVGPDCSFRSSPWRDEREDVERPFERFERLDPADEGRDTVEGGARFTGVLEAGIGSDMAINVIYGNRNRSLTLEDCDT